MSQKFRRRYSANETILNLFSHPRLSTGKRLKELNLEAVPSSTNNTRNVEQSEKKVETGFCGSWKSRKRYQGNYSFSAIFASFQRSLTSFQKAFCSSAKNRVTSHQPWTAISIYPFLSLFVDLLFVPRFSV